MNHRELLIQQFTEAIHDCRGLYVDKSVECILANPDLESHQRNEFLNEVEHRFNQLLIKVCVEVAWSDCVWSPGEAHLAQILMEDLMRKPIREKNLGEALNQLSEIANAEQWRTVLEPFTLLEELDQFRPELESALMRMANIVAKIDGDVTQETIGQLKNLKWQIQQFLVPAKPWTFVPQKPPAGLKPRPSTVDSVLLRLQVSHASQTADQTQPNQAGVVTALVTEPLSESAAQNQPAHEPLEDVIEELNGLIGIESIKKEVKGLVNFLKIQAQRKSMGLPENQISLHMVFEGNPGTGKTTVARILGRVYGSMGVLNRGHLIETDRGGLVAEYAGQTAPKTNAKIDEALDGVLFIDEAYSLIAEDGNDPYGAEALQTLLKRAEDDRQRLIIILAGYSNPMARMLQSNQGLSSRFSRQFSFPDYCADELCQIFDVLAEKSHYVISSEVRQKLTSEISRVIESKDDHFGNGRLMRNVFEKAMRRLADRVVDMPELTPELLTTFEASDIAI